MNRATFKRLPKTRRRASFAPAKGQEMSDSDDYRERIRQSFGLQPAMKTIGAELTRIEQAMVEIELPFDPKLTQQHGLMHGGIISTALDTACTYAAYSVVAPDAALLKIGRAHV